MTGMSEIVWMFTQGDVGIDLANSNKIDIAKLSEYIPPDNIHTLKSYANYCGNSWDIIYFEKSCNCFNAIRMHTADEYKKHHYVYTARNFLYLIKNDSNKISEDDITELFK